MQPTDRLTTLFKKFLDGQCTAEELTALVHHIEREGKHTPLRHLIREQLHEHLPNDETLEHRTQKILVAVDEAMAKIKALQNSDISAAPDVRKRTYRMWLSMAAALLVTVVVWGYYGGWFTPKALPNEVQISTRNGENKHFTLADGTQVWLNAGSALVYPETFGLRFREVQLQGEAFFEVAEDAERPFIVALQDSLIITVLGTSFNAKSYTGEGTAKVAVSAGRVNVQAHASAHEGSLLLEPGEEGLWQRELATFTKRPISLSDIAVWRSNRLRFDEEPFHEVVATLQRRYNVHIEVKREELLAERTSLAIGDEPLQEILIPLGFSHHFNYHFANDSTVIIE